MRKILAIILSAALFLGNPTAYSFDVADVRQGDGDGSFQGLTIPKKFGQVVKLSGDISKATPEKPFVIYLQDAHGNYEGQKNIVNIVHHIQNRWLSLTNSTSFFLEGLVGGLDPEFLKTDSNLEILEQTLSNRMKRGEISAASYLSTLEPNQFDFIALEEGPIYKTNLISFKSALENNRAPFQRLKYYRSEIESILPKVFSPRSLEIYRKTEERERRIDLLPAHIKYLKKTLFEIFVKEGKNDRDKISHLFQKTFPSLSGLLDFEKESQGIDQQELERELTEFFPQERLDDNGEQKLLSRYRKSPADFQAAPALKKHFDLQLEREKLDSEGLFAQLEKLEALLIRLTSLDPKTIQSLNLLKRLELLENLLKLEIVKSDWEAIKADPTPLKSEVWLEELSNLKSGIDQNEIVLATQEPDIDHAYDRSRMFYHGAEKRDEVFVSKMNNFLETQNDDEIVFLLTGGFHEGALTAYFEKNGIPFALVSPCLDELERGHQLYLKGMRNLHIATIMQPFENDEVDVSDSNVPKSDGIYADFRPIDAVVTSAALGEGEENVPAQAMVDDFRGFGRELIRFGIAVRNYNSGLPEGATEMFTETQTGWLDEARRLGRDAFNLLKARKLSPALIQWGKTLLEFHRFLNHPEVQRILDNSENVELREALKNVQSEENKINNQIAESMPNFELEGMNVKVKGKSDEGKTVAIGRLIIIDDVNSTEGTQALNDLHPDDIVVVSDFPTRAVSVQAAGIIMSVEAGKTAHAPALARGWGVPVFELPSAQIFLKKMAGKPVKITIDSKGNPKFSLANEEDFESGRYLTTRDRHVLMEAGTYAMDRKGLLHSISADDLVWKKKTQLNVRIVEKISEGVSFHGDDAGNLWLQTDWDERTKVVRKIEKAIADSNNELQKSLEAKLILISPFAKKGQWFEGLLQVGKDYLVDQDGLVYEKGEPVVHPRKKDSLVPKGDWYVGAFGGDAVLLNEAQKKKVDFPKPFVEGNKFLDLEQVSFNLAPTVGVKAAQLGEQGLSGVAGIPKKGFVATFAAFEDFLEENDLKEKISKMAAEIEDYRNEEQLEKVTEKIRELIKTSPISDEMKEEIKKRIREAFGDRPIIIRSSTNLEDLPGEGAPGIYDSVRVIDPHNEKELFDALKTVWASIWNPRAAALRHNVDIPHEQVYPAALFLEYIEGKYGGVVYTAGTKGDYNEIIMEVTHGGSYDLVDNSDRLPAQYVVHLPGGEIETLQANSNIDRYTFFKDGRPVTRDVEADLKNRPVIANESEKRTVIEEVLKMRDMSAREAMDFEFLVDKSGKVHFFQLRPMVQDEFPVNGWQDFLVGSNYSTGIHNFLGMGLMKEAVILEVNQHRLNRNVERLIKMLEDYQGKSLETQLYIITSLMKLVRSYPKNSSDQTAVLEKIAELFKKEGLLYELYLSSIVMMVPDVFVAFDRLVNLLEKKDLLPEEVYSKKVDVFRSNIGTTHFTADQAIRVINELMDREGLVDDRGEPKKDLTEEKKRLYEDLKKQLDIASERWKPEKLLKSDERLEGDDPQRLLWLFKQITPYLNSPRKDKILSDLFLGSENSYVRDRVLRHIDNPEFFQKEADGFSEKADDEDKMVRDLEKRVINAADIILSGRDSALYQVGLDYYLEKIEKLHPKFGDKRDAAQLHRDKLLKASKNVLRVLRGKFFPTTKEMLEEIKKKHFSDKEVLKEMAEKYSLDEGALVGILKEMVEKYSLDEKVLVQNLKEMTEKYSLDKEVLTRILEEMREVDLVDEKALEEAKKKFPPDSDEMNDVFKYFAIPGKITELLELERDLTRAYRQRKQYSEAADGIEQFLVNRRKAEERAADIFHNSEDAGARLRELTDAVNQIEGAVAPLGLQGSPEYEKIVTDFLLIGAEVERFYRQVTDTTNPAAFREPLSENVSDPSAALNSFRNTGHFLNFAQDSSSNLVKLMIANHNLRRAIQKFFSPEIYEGLSDDVKVRIDALPEAHRNLDEFLKNSWDHVAHSAFLDKHIYKLPAEAYYDRKSLETSSLGVEEVIDNTLLNHYGLNDPVFRKAFAENFMKKVRADGDLLTSELSVEPSLIVMEGVNGLPESLDQLKQILFGNNHLVLIDPERTSEEVKKMVLERYGEVPEELVLKGLKGKSFSRSLTNLLFEIESKTGAVFDDRVGFVVSEESRKLMKNVAKVSYPHRVLYAPSSPNEIVLPLSFHIVANDGRVADRYLDYVEQRGDQVFRILVLDDLIRQMLIESEAERLMDTAA